MTAHHHQAALLFLSLLIATATACTGTRVGNPIDPDAGEPPEIKVVTIDARRVSLTQLNDGVRIDGEPGAVAPGGSEARAAGTDPASTFVAIESSEDGAFSISVPDTKSLLFVVQARSGLSVSPPLLLGIGISPLTVEDCLSTPGPGYFLDVADGTQVSVRVSNTCAVDVPLSLRLLTARGVELVTTDATVPSDGSADIPLRLAGTPGEAVDAILLAEPVDPEVGALAVAISGLISM